MIRSGTAGQQVLITGATGFIGRRLVNRLSSLGYRLRCVVRPMSDTTALLNKPNVEIVCADLTDTRSLFDVVRGVEIIYHLALDYSRPEVDGVRNLLEACHSNNLRRFVYFSSIAVVGLSAVMEEITESSPCLPDTEYGRAKLRAEELLLQAYAKNGFPVVILRPTSVYGIGETNFWLPVFQAVHSERLVRLFGDGSNLLSLCFIDNLIDGAVLAHEQDSVTGQVFIISDHRPYSFREVVDAIAESCGVRSPQGAIPKWLALPVAQLLDYLWRLELKEPIVPFLPANVTRWIAHYPTSIAKAKAGLGFKPRINLVEGTRITADWYRQNGFLCRPLEWSDGALSLPAVPVPSSKLRDRALRAGAGFARLVWRTTALTWRLPPRIVRRVRRLASSS